MLLWDKVQVSGNENKVVTRLLWQIFQGLYLFFLLLFLFEKGIAGHGAVLIFLQSALPRNQSQVYNKTDLAMGVGSIFVEFHL